jgi:tetratricopeptide (TPR) repeat protein
LHDKNDFHNPLQDNNPFAMFARILIALSLAGNYSLAESLAAQQMIVENGQPRAEIVIAEEPSRSTRLAANELRTYLEKISGAELPILTQPVEGNIHIFVGRSSHTDKLGITDEKLKFGSYRIVSGVNWLVLLGDDTDFVPREPWARNNGDRVSGKLQKLWEERTGESFGVPNGGMYKNRARLPGKIGRPDDAKTKDSESLEIWAYDERGSFNAVCGYLRSLGVRWYMPGELGEVVPKLRDIPLPKIDQTVTPDFAIRQFNVRFGTVSEDTMLWAARLGMRIPYGLMIAHGMHTMTQTETVLREHPEWFALYGGKRDNQLGERLNHLCYSNPELFDATVRWARDQFDVYDFETVSIMPPDAYISLCQCSLCEGKDEPEMGARGRLSNHVWDFVNRVAKELRKSHPDKRVVCCAYGANTKPPVNIEKLEPNVQVVIVGGRRPRNSLPEQRQAIRQLRAGWLKKTDNPLMVFENYPFTSRGFYLPAFTTRTIGESINATKGVSRGEDTWLSIGRDFDTEGIGLNHILMYFTARMYWGGKGQDAEAMLEEYCRLFYGPARPQMLAFFRYCEDHWQSMEQDEKAVATALELFDQARIKASEGTIYSRRVGIMDEYLERLRSKAELLRQKRGPVPKLRIVWKPKEPIVIDGKLNDQYWRDCPTAATGRLSELQTGGQPVFGTTIKTGWHRDSLYFGIRCDERPGEALNVATKKNEDQSIWYGDVVEIELDTDMHSYYQIAINPAGALIDLDRSADKNAWLRWDSQAEVATHVADDHWTMEIKIPVTADENDPLNQVTGNLPSQSLPWHFNVCRQRIRENGSEYSAFSPTGTASFHESMKFAYLYDGRSHQFEVDSSVTDYILASQTAAALMRSKKLEEALGAYVVLASDNKLTDFQKSAALAQASACARALKDFERAETMAERISLESVAKTVRMENLLAQREWRSLIEQFAEEKIQAWPFWQIGAGAFARGRAFYAAGHGEAAAADLLLALEFTPNSRGRLSIQSTLADTYEKVLEDDDKAIQVYQEIVQTSSNAGSADYFSAVQGTARVLTRRGDFDKALKVFNLIDMQNLHGYWRGSMLLARGSTLTAAGRNKEALQIYRAMQDDPRIEARHKSEAKSRTETQTP